jgi:trans-aconitate 2-methyltransferase
MTDWNADLYLRFEDERTRPSIDLLARVPGTPAHCIDLGCGPGNSTELLVRRFPQARVSGLDSSPDMIEKARKRLPRNPFLLADLATWAPQERVDLLFANAVLQWLPDHRRILGRLVDGLSQGGSLAVQMPDNLDEPSHVAMRAVAAEGPWAAKLGAAGEARSAIAPIEDYHAWLTGAGCRVDIWRTTYVHPLQGAAAVVSWFSSTALRPYLDPLPEPERAAFLAAYEARIAAAYPARPDGTVLLRFPRLFMVATRA